MKKLKLIVKNAADTVVNKVINLKFVENSKRMEHYHLVSDFQYYFKLITA